MPRLDLESLIHSEENCDKDMIYKTPVSRDPNCEKLAEDNGVDAVISISSLQTIFDNFGPNFEEHWEIPFEVKETGDKR